MTLVDTSVWIDFFAARNTTHVQILESLIEQIEDLCLCGVILTEVLQGIRDDKQYKKTEAVLSNLIFIPMGRSTFLLASNIYRTLRLQGTTLRNTLDCMIAAVCIEHDVQLLQNDRDFERIANVFDLRLVPGRIVQ
jgi:hypothetical protein